MHWIWWLTVAAVSGAAFPHLAMRAFVRLLARHDQRNV